MKKKSISILLILTMILSMMVSCSNTQGNGETTTAKQVGTSSPADSTTPAVQTDASGNIVSGEVDQNGYLKDSLPADLNYSGREVTLLAWDGQSYEEFNVDTQTGELVNDALYNRNRTVEDRLGIKLNVVKTKGGSSDYEAFTTLLRADVMAGGGNSYEYDMIAAYSRTTAMCAYQGLTQNLLATKYFDVEKPWWPQTLIDQSTINDKLYFCSGDISLSLFHNLDVIYFNKAMADSYNIGSNNLYQMVIDGSWTLDKMIELTKGVYRDLDGDTVKSSGDQYGFVAANTQSQPLVWGCGITAIETDDKGAMKVSDSFTGEKMQGIQEKLFGWLYNTDDAFFASSTGIGNDAFAEGRSLFFCNIATYTMSKFNIDGLSFGILPPPKYDEKQENYYSVEGNAFSLYAIANTPTDADMCSAVLEAMGSEGYRQLSPAVFESAMKIKYASDDLTSRMFDITRAGVVFDNGRIYSGIVNNIFTKTYNDAIKANNPAWISTMESLRTQMDTSVETLNTTFAALD